MQRGRIYDRTWLETARRAKGYTLEVVAKSVGVDVSTYARIERGLIVPNVKTGLLICSELEISPTKFLTEQIIG